MRQIKFRAWNPTENYMFYEENSEGNTYNGFYFDGNEVKAFTSVCYDILNPVDSKTFDCIVLQYTGLKDSKGTDIYEGDIVSVDVETETDALTMQDDYILGEVVYDHAGFKVKIKADDGEYVTEIDHDTLIVGNIYEHKHLLDD